MLSNLYLRSTEISMDQFVEFACSVTRPMRIDISKSCMDPEEWESLKIVTESLAGQRQLKGLAPVDVILLNYYE